ncbi:hypothetical protein [Streptomyces sp. 4F14]|uniref:hypothetical protein n=1 Tax=Streptomyces sp. 4F14 TaxID=3394380 RepID=UPI003A860B3D
MSHTPPSPNDVPACVEEIRQALALHGLQLPSLGLDLPSYAGRYNPPLNLLSLGNCPTTTALALAAILREAADK